MAQPTHARRENPKGADPGSNIPPEKNPALRLGDIDDVVREHPAFTSPSIRALIHRAADNGLSEHIYRIGRRVLIDLNGFEQWIREKQRRGMAR